MEVVIPAAPIMDFDFSGARSSPYLSAPSTPRRFGECFFSAPTSPTRMSEFYPEFDSFSAASNRQNGETETSLGVPFDWEEKPGTPKSPKPTKKINEEDDDFAFDFSEDSEKASLFAEELFDGGKIRPLKPPPRLQVDEFHSRKVPVLSPRSPISQGKKIIREVFSPRRNDQKKPSENGRGRERVEAISKNSSRRASRSLSPLRVSEYPWEEEDENSKLQLKQTTKQSSFASKHSISSSSKASSKKWSFKDFLLFRSASEGHASDKYPFRKYSYSSLFKKPEDAKNASFRSVDSPGSVSSSRRRVSAHELHYTMNKAVSENMKKKTFLPYKQGILGRLAFNPAVHALATGFGSLTTRSQ